MKIVQSTKQHTNSEYCGYCCPHCNDSADYYDPGDSADHAHQVKCKGYGELFAIWDEATVLQTSGFIEAEDEE